MAFEVFLDNIPLPRGGSGKSKKKLELSSLQAVDKDLAFVVNKDVPAINIITAAKNLEMTVGIATPSTPHPKK